MRAQRRKEEETHKGFDALEASFLEKGLVAAGSSRAMASKTIGEAHSSHQRHHSQQEKVRRAEFLAGEKKRVLPARAEFIISLAQLKKPKQKFAPPQMKKKDEGGEGEKKQR